MKLRALVVAALLALLPAAAAPNADAAVSSLGQQLGCGGYASSAPASERRAKSRCLLRAFGRGASASLVLRRVDRRGRTLAQSHFRVLGRRQLELFVDVRLDAEGARRWQRFVCTQLGLSPSGSPAPSRCRETVLTARGPRTGRRLLDCGRLVVRFGSDSSAAEQGNRCLVAAFDRATPALLVVTLPTVEGDAITRYYSVLGPGRVESLVDATLDRFGVRQWHRATCTGVSLTPRGSLELRDCIHSTLPATFPSR